MNQIKSVLASLFEPLTKVETYQTLISNIIMVVIYIVVAWFAREQMRQNVSNVKHRGDDSLLLHHLTCSLDVPFVQV